MLALAQFNLATLAVAVAIGIVTGRWMFARRATPEARPEDQNPS